jgi:FKBP-type peptidyl-prolyl cis-trans isomerase
MIKKTFIVVLGWSLCSCNAKRESPSELKTDKEKTSYALGYNAAFSFKKYHTDVDPGSYNMGFNDLLSGGKIKLSDGERALALQKLAQGRETKRLQLKVQNEKLGREFLEKNKLLAGWKTTPSGLQYKVEKSGSGHPQGKMKKYVVQFRCQLINGQVIDDSYKRGNPVEISLDGVIPAWKEALPQMKAGSIWKLAVPSQLAYGEEGRAPQIPPGAALLFEIEIAKR